METRKYTKKHENLSFGTAFEYIKAHSNYGMRLPSWKEDVVIYVQNPDEDSYMTAPYLYVESRFGRVPWKETNIELFSNEWELVEVETSFCDRYKERKSFKDIQKYAESFYKDTITDKCSDICKKKCLNECKATTGNDDVKDLLNNGKTNINNCKSHKCDNDSVLARTKDITLFISKVTGLPSDFIASIISD